MSVISELATCCPSHGWRLVRALVCTKGARIWFPFAPSLSTDSSHLCPPSLLKVATNGTKRNAVRLCATTKSVAICNSSRKKSRKSRIKAYWKAGYLQLAMHTIIKNVYRSFVRSLFSPFGCWFSNSFSTASCLLLFQFNYQGNVPRKFIKIMISSHMIRCFDRCRDIFWIFFFSSVFLLINLIKVLVWNE